MITLCNATDKFHFTISCNIAVITLIFELLISHNFFYFNSAIIEMKPLVNMAQNTHLIKKMFFVNTSNLINNLY